MNREVGARDLGKSYLLKGLSKHPISGTINILL